MSIVYAQLLCISTVTRVMHNTGVHGMCVHALDWTHDIQTPSTQEATLAGHQGSSKVRGEADSLLTFCHRYGSWLARKQVVKNLWVLLVATGVQYQNFSGHSFRIGAATTAAAKGVADSTIQTFGIWKSESFKCYIRMQKSELASILDKLIA